MARESFDERCLRDPTAPGCPLSPQGGAAALFRSQAYPPTPTAAPAAPQPQAAPMLPGPGAAVVPYGVPSAPWAAPVRSPNPFQPGPVAGVERMGAREIWIPPPQVSEWYKPTPSYELGSAVPPSVAAIVNQRGFSPVTTGLQPARPPQGPPNRYRPGAQRGGG